MPKKELIKKSKAKKEVQWEELQQCCINYKKILFVDVDNVTSKQISVLRQDLRKIDARVFMGKNVSRTRQNELRILTVYDRLT